MTKDEALDLALEALEYIENNYMSLPKSGSEAITAIKQARSAPVQEPQHIVHSNGRYSPLLTRMMNKRTESNIKQVIHLYDEPPAAPVQEPVATIDSLEQEIYENTREFVSLNVMEWLLKRLNTTPPAAQRQWVGLTDDEFENIELGCRSTPFGKIEAMRKVEAKLKEKNGGVV